MSSMTRSAASTRKRHCAASLARTPAVVALPWTDPADPANLLLIKAPPPSCVLGRFRAPRAEVQPGHAEGALHLARQGRLKPMFQVYALGDTPAALDALLARRAVGKLVIDLG